MEHTKEQKTKRLNYYISLFNSIKEFCNFTGIGYSTVKAYRSGRLEINELKLETIEYLLKKAGKIR